MTALRPALFAWVVGGFLAPSEAAPQETTVVGLMVDSAGRPLHGALVFLEPGRHQSLSDSSGAFRLGPVASGSYTLFYRMAGYAPRTFNILLEPGTRDVGRVALQAGAIPTAMLRGTVMERLTSTPLARATIEVNGTLVAETDATGGFDLSDVPIRWGTNQLRVRHRSFADTEVIHDFWVSNPARTFEFSVTLEVEPIDLPGVTVEAARPVSARLQGFYDRMENTTGVFLTRQDIDAREPRRMTDLLAPVMSSRRSRAASGFSLASCAAPLVFIDGQLIGDESRPVYVDPNLEPSIDEYLDPDQVEAVEIYDGVASVPTQFSLLGSGCGVVVFWTR